MEQLASYLKNEKLTQEAFAAQIGVDQARVSRLLRNLVRPSIDLAFVIERETGGAVPASVWARSTEQEAQP